MKSRIELEDLIQRLTCELLPKMSPQDIRPAYQQEDMTGKALLTEDYQQEYEPFTPNDNFMYIRAEIGTNTIETYIGSDGDVDVKYDISVTYSIYGPDSANLAICLSSLYGLPYAASYLNDFGLYLSTIPNTNFEMHEIVNEQWMERHDLTIVLYESVRVKSPFGEIVSVEGKDAVDSVSLQIIAANDSSEIIYDSGVETIDVEK